MLVRQDLRRRHDTCLVAVVDHQQRNHQCHQGLPRTYIALQQPIHLLAGLHVGVYLFDHAFLRVRQFERQQVFVEVVELLPYPRHLEPVGMQPPCRSTAQDRQLVVEQLLELQPLPRFLHAPRIRREVNLMHRFGAVHQMVALQYIRLQRLRQSSVHLRHQAGDDLPHRFAVQPGVFHPLRGVVARLQPAHHLRRHFLQRRQLRMNEVVRTVEP